MKALKEKDKRYSNSYKCTSSTYNKAMRRAKKEKLKLATLIEVWVIAYANKMPFLIDSDPIEIVDLKKGGHFVSVKMGKEEVVAPKQKANVKFIHP